MTTRTDDPTTEYIAKVREITKSIKGYEEEDISSLLAYSCWRHGAPFPKEYFEGDDVKFSDDDQQVLKDYVTLLQDFNASLDNDPDDPIKHAQHPATVHYHGSTKDDHEGGGTSHSHDDKPGAYSKTAPSSQTNSSEENMFSEAIVTSLGLPKDASEAQVIAAIGAIKSASFSEEERKKLDEMAHSYAISQYMEETVLLTAVPGSAKELAEKLVTVSEKASPEIAAGMLKDYQSFQEQADKAGVTKTILQSKFNESGEEQVTGAAETQIAKYMEDEKVELPIALAAMATGTPEQRKTFHAYNAEQKEKDSN